MGFGTITPSVILRNVLENPGWYTAYTPYQAEISQGRMEALLVFQTMVQDLTGMDICNASLLDEATAAAEAMTMCHRIQRGKRNRFVVSNRCHPQTIAVIQTRAIPLNIDVDIVDLETATLDTDVCGVLAQYPDTYGHVGSLQALSDATKAVGALLFVATDLLALTLLQTPGEVGLTSKLQFTRLCTAWVRRAACRVLATRSQYQRMMPDVSLAYLKTFMEIQRYVWRFKLANNISVDRKRLYICTAQVFLRRGWNGRMAWARGAAGDCKTCHGFTKRLAATLHEQGYQINHDSF